MKDKVSIDDCCQILDYLRVPLNGEEREKIKGNIPYYGANGIQGYINNYIFDEDLILLAEDGGNFEEYQKRPIAYRISGKSWVNNHAHILKAKTGYDQDFIFYSIVHKNILTYIKGGTRSKLNQSELRDIEINYFSEDHQRKIAKILNTADAVIEKTEAAIAKYRAIKQGMMQDLFTRGIDLQTGQLRPTFEDAPHLYKETDMGWIPKEWEVTTFERASSLITDFTANGSFESLRLNVNYYYEPKYARLIRLTDLRQNLKNDGVYVDKDGFEFLRKSSLIKNDIMLANVGEYTGYACLMPKVNYPATIAPNMFLIRASELFNSHFLFYSMRYTKFQKQVDSVSASSATKLLNKTNFRAMKTLLLHLKEQKEIAFRLNTIDNLIENERANLAKHQSLKKGLMQDLLTGKVEVEV